MKPTRWHDRPDAPTHEQQEMDWLLKGCLIALAVVIAGCGVSYFIIRNLTGA